MAEASQVFKNHMLRALSAADLELLRPGLEAVELNVRRVLEPIHQPIEHVYFPESGFVSIVAQTKPNRAIEVALIGREGMTGVSLLFGAERACNDAYVQSAGVGWRIATEPFLKALDTSPTLRGRLLHFAQVLYCQTSQTALCNGSALIEQRLARWLLMAHDRLQHDDLALTHDFLALMLGVRRPGVTVALQLLEGKGLIRSMRGLVRICDRKGLLAISGNAYGVPEAEHERLLSLKAMALSA